MKNFIITLLLLAISVASLYGQTPVFKIFDYGNVGIGVDSAFERLHVNGAILLGTTSNLNNGVLRWTGTEFQGRQGNEWVSLIDSTDADSDPTNELQNWSNLPGIPANIDTDATDDFSGSWSDLTDVPADIADGDNVNDADSDPTNELQNWSNLPGIPANIDTDATDDFSGSWSDLTDVPADIADGDNVNDADSDPTNELQNWSNLPGIPANIDTDATDDFSGSWSDLTDVPADIADGDNINDADSDPTNELQNWSNLPGIPANIDTDATDDFSGSWLDLTDVPADIADGDNVNDADSDPTNELQNWSNLPGIPANIDTDATDDFSGSWSDLTDVPADIADGDNVNDADSDPTNEMQVLSISEDTLFLSGGGYVILPAESVWNKTDNSIFYLDGKVGIGTDNPLVDLQINGHLDVSGEFTSASDRRLKKDIKKIHGARDILKDINAVSYTYRHAEYKSLNLPQSERLGFIAQEMEKVLPSLVVESRVVNDQKMKSVDYIQLIPVLVAAIQELEEEKMEYKTQLETLSAEVSEIKAMLETKQGFSTSSAEE